MSLPLSHAGGSVDGISAALDLRFASSLSLTSTSGITPSFSRASSGTYFGSDGLLKYAPYNLVQYSEQFNDAYWLKYNSPTITANTTETLAPNGTNTAEKIVSGTTAETDIYKIGLYSGSAAITFSIYAKAGTVNFFGIGFNAGATDYTVNFDLTNGTSNQRNLSGYTGASALITSVGNGWYRCSLTVTNPSVLTGVYIYCCANSLTTSATTSGNSTYLWGAQLEIASTLGTYVPTTNATNSAPRFDHTYNGTSWVSRGLLVEEQRTNVCTYSEDFTNGVWTKTRSSISSNVTAAPNGTSTADKLIEGASSTTHLVTFTTVTGGVFSVFAKASERSWIALQQNLSGNYCYFNLSSGSVGSASGATGSITSVGNGWYRCSIAVTSASSIWDIFLATGDNGASYTGDGTSGVFLWGAQIENGSFPTSYIPTTTAAVTRSADVCQITGSDFTSFWNASEGSFVTEADSIGYATTGSDRYIVAFNSGGNANIAHAIFLPTTGLTFDVYNSAIQARISNTQPNAGDLFKLASCYKANDFASTLNGGAVQTDTSGTVPTITNVGIGHYPSFNQYANCHIARLRYFNKRLTNTNLRYLSGGPKSFMPDQILGLQLWVDASDSSTLYTDSALTTLAVADGDPIGGWKDKSGNNRHALQSDGLKKPALKLAVKNGKNGIYFSQAAQQFFQFSARIIDLTDLFFVLRKDAVTNNSFICRDNIANDRDGISFPDSSASGSMQIQKGNLGNGSTLTGPTVSTNQYYVISAKADGTNRSLQASDSLVATATNPDKIIVGELANYHFAPPLYCLKGHILEVIFYTSNLSVGDISMVRSYLNAKWAVTP
jgi:hypothetical protein